MAIKVQFEIGHTATVRTNRTPEGFTHDWELYVQGVNKSDISTFVDKVVFNLHESFPKPKRSIKEPPYMIKEYGYAGFELNIDIYFRNRDEPKRVTYPYDLNFQHEGPPIHRCEIKKFVFESPSEDFRQKLVKGGGIPVSGVVGAAITSEDKSLDMNVQDSRGQMVGKPKLSTDATSSSSSKKHKQRTDDSKLNTFANLFGTPITKSTSKFSPDPKAKTANGGGIGPTGPSVPGKGKDKSGLASGGAMSGTGATGSGAGSGKDKEKSDKRDKHKQLASPHKEKLHDEKESKKKSDGKHDKREEKKKDKKDKEKEKDRTKDKSSKRSLSPKSAATSVPSPKRPSPVRSSSAASRDETTAKSSNKTSESDKRGSSSSSGKKSKKEKKSHDKDREHKEKHRSDVKETAAVANVASSAVTAATSIPNTAAPTQQAKASNVSVAAKTDLNSNKNQKTSDKDKDLKKSDLKSSEKESTPVQSTTSDKKSSTDKDKKSHKHKKKDKNKEKEKDKDKEQSSKKSTSNKEKKDKKDKTVKNESAATPTTNIISNNGNSSAISKKSTDVDQPTETGSAKSTSSSVSASSSTTKTTSGTNKPNNNVAALSTTTTNNTGTASSTSGLSTAPNDLSDVDSVNSESLHTVSNSNSDKIAAAQNSDSSNSSFPELPTAASKASVFQAPANPQPTPPTTPLATNSNSNEPSRIQAIPSGEKKTHRSGTEKSKAEKNAEKEDKKRRRNSTAVNTFVEPPLKQIKKDLKPSREKSQSPLLRTEEKQTFLPPPATTSTIPIQNTAVSALNLEYLSELQELHQKIMTLQDNEELQQVVEMIAATGRYEITNKTFDFDLCKLDRHTVQRLQDFFATSVS